MNWEQEQKLKAMAAQENQCGATTTGGMLEQAKSEYRPTLRDRLKRTIESAQQEERRSRKANELYDLLEKNHEVARILELIEELQ